MAIGVRNSNQISARTIGNTHDTSPARKDTEHKLKLASAKRDRLYERFPEFAELQLTYQKALVLPEEGVSHTAHAMKCRTAKTALETVWQEFGIDYPNRILLMQEVEKNAVADIAKRNASNDPSMVGLLDQPTPARKLKATHLHRYVAIDEHLRDAIAQLRTNCPDDPMERNARLQTISQRLEQLGAGEHEAQKMISGIANARAAMAR